MSRALSAHLRGFPCLTRRLYRSRSSAWLGVLVWFVLTLLGPTFDLDDWVLGVSPFWHVPDVAATSPDCSGLAWVTLVTAGLLLVGFRRRDLAR